MDRRSFLKALGVGGGATALTGCGIDDNRYYTPVESVLPYIARPEQVTPGTNSYFATVVGTGPAAWPATAVHRDGRVINVSANRAAPLPPAVPSGSYFELQRHFSPDRITAPTKGGAPVAWDAALAELGDASRAGKKVVWLGPLRSGSLAALLDQVVDQAVHWEPLGREAEAIAANAVFGSPGLPRYDLSKAHYVLSFGASFLSGAWGGPGDASAYAAARNGNIGNFVARFATVAPIKDQTGANADEWYACKPGAEAAVCLAVAKLVAAKTGKGGAVASMLAGADEAAAAAAAGLTVENLQEIADHFAAGPAVALPGGVIGGSAAAVQLAAATYVLNLVGNSSDTFLPGGYAGKIHGHADLAALVEDMKAGKIGVLLVDDVDPIHASALGADFAAALGSVGLVVAVTSFPNETTAKAGMVLPTHTVFEDWGDEEPTHGMHLVRQPGQLPLHDTRSLTEILLAIGKARGRELVATTPRDVVAAYLAAHVWVPMTTPVVEAPVEEVPAEEPPGRGRGRGRREEPAPLEAPAEVAPVVPPHTTPEFARWFEGVLAAGFVQVDHGDHGSLRPQGRGVDFAKSGEPSGNGDLFLVAFPHPHLLDGRYANEPWAQEAPDPMTGQVWDTWALVHPRTAASMGLKDNDLLTITTEAGSISVGVEVHPCVRPDVIAVPTGGGHSRASGRYADGVGQNVVSVLPKSAGNHGEQVFVTKCSASKAGGKADLVSTYGHDDERDRGFAAFCNAEAFARVGDAEAHHAGEMTGIHHLELDERLREKGIKGFYDLPDHPTYRFGMTVDTNLCTGCGACNVACYAENNLPVVGKEKVKQGREMSWIRINRYYKDKGLVRDHGVDGDTSVHWMPMMCQQCGHAPCESVCPVLATYHTIDGLNAMVYNRCAGTRYCSNACPYSARKFNYHTYVWPEPYNLQLNPDVVTRTMGVMEKCTFCVQRIRSTKSAYRDQGFRKVVPNEALEQLTACAEACPSQAITFGNINDEASTPARSRKSGRHFTPIADINTYPAVNYLAKASFYFEPGHGSEGGHAEGGEHGGGGHEAPAHGADKSHEPAHDAHDAH